MFSKSKKPARLERLPAQGNLPLSKPAHALSIEAIIDEVSADDKDGLSTEDAKQRLEKYGPNELGSTDGVQPLKILARQVANAMTLAS